MNEPVPACVSGTGFLKQLRFTKVNYGKGG